jgi:hypothetical protein
MTLGIESPAILFPAISFLLLAYSNRFLAIASLMRELHDEYILEPSPNVLSQILNLRRRIRLIRDMQTMGVCGVFLSVLSIALLYIGITWLAGIAFAIALVSMLISLGMSVTEIYISTSALFTELEDIIEEDQGLFLGLRKRLKIKHRQRIITNDDDSK